VLLEKHDMLVAIERVVGEAEQQHCRGVQQVEWQGAAGSHQGW
jgi:hypothetical protein